MPSFGPWKGVPLLVTFTLAEILQDIDMEQDAVGLLGTKAFLCPSLLDYGK